MTKHGLKWQTEIDWKLSSESKFQALILLIFHYFLVSTRQIFFLKLVDQNMLDIFFIVIFLSLFLMYFLFFVSYKTAISNDLYFIYFFQNVDIDQLLFWIRTYKRKRTWNIARVKVSLATILYPHIVSMDAVIPFLTWHTTR